MNQFNTTMISPSPSILEIFVLWHPGDEVGKLIYERLLKHYRSDALSGLASGVVEVFSRSASPDGNFDTPPLKIDACASKFTVVIPIVGEELRDAYIDNEKWRKYLSATLNGGTNDLTYAVIPLPLVGVDLSFFDSNDLKYLKEFQYLAPYPEDIFSVADIEIDDANAQELGRLERDLNRVIIEKASAAGSSSPSLRIFVSYANKDNVDQVDSQNKTVLQEAISSFKDLGIDNFVDKLHLVPLDNWKSSIDDALSSSDRYISALLVIRTDNYAVSPNTQREVTLAKHNEVPIVAISALTEGESRGSFLLDQVPTVRFQPGRAKVSIVRAINRLIDETLRFVLWHESKERLSVRTFDWYPATSPELLTLNSHIINLTKNEMLNRNSFWILHPDPTIQEPEHEEIIRACAIAGINRDSLHIRTPRSVIVRGESASSNSSDISSVDQIHLLSPSTIVGFSMARSNNLASLGLHGSHLARVVAEISRLVSACGGALLYGGMVGTHSPDLSKAMMESVFSYARSSPCYEESNAVSFSRRYFYLWVPLHKIRENWKERDEIISELRRYRTAYGDIGQIRVVGWNSDYYTPDNVPLPLDGHDVSSSSSALFTKFRETLVAKSTVRLALGGKIIPQSESREPNEGYSGDIPGVVEETLLSLRAHKHVYISAGYGGAASAIASYLDIPGAECGKDALSTLLRNPLCVDALQEIRTLYRAENNHLSSEELRTFTSSYRPTELATLLVKGLTNEQHS